MHFLQSENRAAGHALLAPDTGGKQKKTTSEKINTDQAWFSLTSVHFC